MKMAMVRVGIDSGCGGIQGPLFKDGAFEYIPIPDGFCIDSRTYGNTRGRQGRCLIDYFPASRRNKMAQQPIHYDPEFETFTYGDPTAPKAGLRYLEPGDMLVFYCGLAGWDFKSEPALYLIGYFEILTARKAGDFSPDELQNLFGFNFHVRHSIIYKRQKDDLILVKGSSNSRLLNKAVLISTTGKDRSGRPLKVLSHEMQQVFGDFGGRISIQRSPTRWIMPNFVQKAAEYVRWLD
jgi:hypothetical protein